MNNPEWESEQTRKEDIMSKTIDPKVSDNEIFDRV